MRSIIVSLGAILFSTAVFAQKEAVLLKPESVDANPYLLAQEAPPTIKLFTDDKHNLMRVYYSPGGGITFGKLDDSAYTKLFGLIQADSVGFMGDTKNRIHNTHNLRNGTYIASARLGLYGAMNPDVKYKLEYDFAFSELIYAYLNYTGWNHIEWKAGQYRPTFSSIELTERADRTFLERDLATDAFFIGYSIGTEIMFYKNAFTFSTGVFEPAYSSVNGIAITGGAPVGVNARLNATPIHTHTNTLHFGLGEYYRESVDGQFTRFHTIPEMVSNHNSFVGLVDTGTIHNSKNFYVSSAEAMESIGSFTVSGDYYLATVNRRLGNPNLTFDGYYVAASYFLTGERQLYDYLNGSFRGISPIQNKCGAWELALRYSNVNLNSHAILGGKENNTTVGLNWYPIEPLKFGLNYIYANANPSQNGLNRRVNIIGFRMQAKL